MLSDVYGMVIYDFMQTFISNISILFSNDARLSDDRFISAVILHQSQ
jgi:hypothetical protein